MRFVFLILITVFGGLIIYNLGQDEPIYYIEEPEEIHLSVDDIIYETNKQRNAPLKENKILNSVALFKAQDMLTNQYFAHTSPSGKEAKDLANDFNYNYVMIGENLAMGIFKDSAELVNDWMNSPGHRENIVSSKYTEIGVGVIAGTYEGENIWMAVQIFGTPKDICPEPDSNLLNQINGFQSDLKSIESEINIFKSKINQDPYNNQYVVEHNNLVDNYNVMHNKVKPLIEEYNQQIAKNNQCLSQYGIN